MNLLPPALRTWGQDRLLRRVVRNSTYLFSSNTVSMVLGIAQSVLAARLLGIDALGLLGIVVSYTSTVNRLFSFRMGELVVRYLGQYVEKKEYDRAGALVKAAGLVEAGTSILAFVFLWLLAPLAARIFVKDPQSTPLIIFYGLTILGNLTAETATGVLQVGNHFRSQAAINLVQSILTALIILIAFLMHGGIWMVVFAYLLGKIILGTSPTVVALYWLKPMLGKGWWKASFSLLPPWRELTQFALSSNFSATVNLVARDSELLWVGAFLSKTEAGYYKVAYAVINLVLMPISPFIATSYPEINRTIVQQEWQQLRSILRKVTVIAAGWTLASGVLLVFFGKYALWIYGVEYIPAYSALLVLLVGFGFANIFFWNRPLLLSLGFPVYPFRVTLWTGLAKVILAFFLVPRFGYVAEAALLSGYFIVSIGLIVWRGFKEVRNKETLLGLEAVG